MQYIQENWMLWLFGLIAGFTALQLLAKGRTQDVQPGMATRSDEFSMKTIFFSFKSGEASLFFTVLWLLGNSFFFSIAIAKNVFDAMPSF